MLYVVGTFVTCLVLFIIGLYLNFKYDRENSWKEAVGFIMSIVFGIVGFFYMFATVAFLKDYIPRETKQMRAEVNRSSLIRMLDENYDPDNLKNALNFNAEQKRSAKYNESAFWYCWENCYVVDTIPIPKEQYTPSNMVKLDAVIEHLAEKASQK